jgi:putative SOS response-associated peptidase YedK
VGISAGWSKTSKATFSSINARADNLETSGAWREPFKRRRCLIPAEFFYEGEPNNPEEPKAPTQPWAVALRDDRLFHSVVSGTGGKTKLLVTRSRALPL